MRVRVPGSFGGKTLEEEKGKPHRHPLDPAWFIIHNRCRATVSCFTDFVITRSGQIHQMLLACFSAKPM